MIQEPEKQEKKPSAKPAATVRKPDPKNKIKLGTGRHLGYISDTLFGEDIER